MLHEINAPTTPLRWVVAFQHRLLKAICQEDIHGTDVTLSWMAALFPRMESKRLNSLCKRKYEKLTTLDRLIYIADLPVGTKQQLLEDFEHDQRVLWQRYDDETIPLRLRGLNQIEDSVVKDVVYRFFESFYTANIYRSQGYYIPCANGRVHHFHLDEFKQLFSSQNEHLDVCSYCDGALSGIQVDHYFPKNDYPFFSCHPLNLIPVCGECNGKKHRAIPLTPTDDDQIGSWFHPYFNSGAGHYTVEINRKEGRLKPDLIGRNELDQKKLANLIELLDLEERWQDGLRYKITHTRKKIRQFRVRRKDKGEAEPNYKDILEKLTSWEEDIVIGSTIHGLIEQAFLKASVEGSMGLLNELWLQDIDGDIDVVTGLPLVATS